jgi:hypothetical protein
MPTARSGLAVATYDYQIFAIGGETDEGVTGIVERYDPTSNTWIQLTAKPTAVSDIGAAVVGGKIYVPGGRLASGEVSDILEIYDPRHDQWEQGPRLPRQLSAYAMVAYEGRLFLFGGWDGEGFVASVFEYDPREERWWAREPLPTARGYAGAAVASGRIWVLGGYDGESALSVNETYSPESDIAGDNPWQQAASMPVGRYAMGVTSVAELIYLVGGRSDLGQGLQPLLYLPQQDRWQAFEAPRASSDWSGLGLVSFGDYLCAIGGALGQDKTSVTMAYRAIYTLSIPILAE